LKEIRSQLSEIHTMIRSQQLGPLVKTIPSTEDIVQQAPAPLAPLFMKEKRSAGPGKWNQFLDEYVAEQAARGIVVRKHNAKMDPNVRKLYYERNGRVPPVKKRNETRRITPPLAAPPMRIPTPVAAPPRMPTPAAPPPPPPPPPPQEEEEAAPQPTAFEGLINTLTGAPSRQPTPNRQPAPIQQSRNNKTITSNTNSRQPTPNRQPAPIQQSRNNQTITSNTNSRNSKPSPATYGYEDFGLNTEGRGRKVRVRVDDELQDFFLDSDMGLYQREGDATGPWVGYLEPGGRIRYTDEPDA
jgi:hypothetical protein